MPIPKPRADQNEEDFIGFCMADPTMNADYPNGGQRYAICISTWQDNNKTINEGVNQMDAIKEIQQAISEAVSNGVSKSELKSLEDRLMERINNRAGELRDC